MEKGKRPHNYLKIAEESETGKKLKAFLAECSEASEKARAWVEKQGGDTYYESPEGFAGGVEMVEFKNTINRKDWTNVQVPTKDGWQSTSLFVPEENSELEKEMMALPVVSEMNLIGILLLKPIEAKDKDGNPIKDKDGNAVILPFSFGDTAPALFRYRGFWYTDVPYESLSDDCQVITEKEYRRRMSATNES
jgi:hypothetical protein